MGQGGTWRRLVAAFGLAAIVAALGGASITTEPAGAGNGLVQGLAIWGNASPAEYQRVAHTGANTVYLDVYWEADSPDANSVHPFDHTEPDAYIIGDIQKATAVGMRVVLMPKVWCNGCPSGWRGDLQPADPHAFLQSYKDMVTKYADLGRRQGLWLLFLGSEMNTLQQYADDWRQIAAAVRQVGFTGLITYQPNWDRTDDVSFWDALDLVTVSAYFPLTSTPRPSVAELKQAWHSSAVDYTRGQNWFAKLAGLATATGKHVLIGEVGYRSSETAAAHPWDERETQTPDQTTQANAYQALLETFSNQPWWSGVIWWQWRGTDEESGNTDMSPKGKQAEQLLTQWWAEGWRPGAGPGAASGSGSGGAGSTPGARTPGAATRTAAARAAGTAPTAAVSAPTTQQATTSDQSDGTTGGVVNAAGDSGAINSPRSVARLTGTSHGRDVVVGIAIVGVLGMGAGVVNLARVRLRTPRPLR